MDVLYTLLGHSVINYPDNINPVAVSIIKDTIIQDCSKSNKIFLELGCSTGALGYRIKQLDPSITWVGLDNNEYALKKARERISAAYSSDLNSINKDELISFIDKPDCIVLVDVLEHIYEPVSFMNIIASSFPDALVLCILPNIACYQTYDQITNHKFEYEDSGIFDKTHRTFYTASSTKIFFGSLGYSVKVGPIYLPDPKVAGLLTQGVSFPYCFVGNKYKIIIDNHEDLASICSYGFGFLFGRI